jgi:hypothetical protein
VSEPELVARAEHALAALGGDRRDAAERLVALIDAHWHGEYFECPPEVAAADLALGDDDAVQAAVWHGVLLRFLVRSARERVAGFPAPIAARFRRQYARLISFATEGRYAHATRRFPARNLFQKDLGLARLAMLPADARVLDVHGKVPRRPLVSRFPASLPFARLVLRIGGFGPIFSSHMHQAMLEDWGVGDDRKASVFFENLSVVEQYFALMPGIRGHAVASWTLDPALDKVSPHLTYASRIPALYGARLIDLGTDATTIEFALAKSRTRRRLYEEGKYMPRTFFRLWAREDLCRCAQDYREGRLRLADHGFGET